MIFVFVCDLKEPRKEKKKFVPEEVELIDPLRQSEIIHFVEGLDICIEDCLVRFIHQSPSIAEDVFIVPSAKSVRNTKPFFGYVKIKRI